MRFASPARAKVIPVHKALTLLAIILAMVLLFVTLATGTDTAGAYTQTADTSTTRTQPQTTPAIYGESPDLAAKVAAGQLPPVHERLPSEPMIIPTLQDGIGKYGGTLRRFYLGPADGCNFFRLSRASLVRFSQDGFSLIPSIARDWEMSEDGREWTFYLREGMKWSDGDDFNADDFVFQYEDVILNEELILSAPWFLRVGSEYGSIEKMDDTTVKFVFPQPNFLFLEVAAQADEACYGRNSWKNVPWAPSHYMKQFHPKYNPNVEQEAQVTGFESWAVYYDYKAQHNLNMDKPTIAPWKLTNSLGDQVVRTERNPYFWAVDEAGNQLPYLDGIQLTLSEGGTEIGTLMAVQGDIDMQGRHIRLGDYIPLKEGETQGDYTLLTWPAFGGSDVAFFFNMSLPGPTGDAIRVKEFRQALSLAIDRKYIQEIMFLGFGEIRQSVPSPRHPHYPGDDIAKLRTEHDPDAANALLDSVFPEKDSEGFRLSNGERIVMSITVTDPFLTLSDAAQVVGRAWEAVGVKTDVNQTTRAQHFTRWNRNEWAVMVWNEDSTGSTFSSLIKRAPQGIGSFHGPGCAQWLINPDGEYAYPCEQESLDLLEMHKRGPGLPEVERNWLGKEIYRTIVENQYNIGIVGLTPMVHGVIVKKNNLNNVPDEAANDWPLRTPNTGFPEQWYFQNGVPPARVSTHTPEPTATHTSTPTEVPAETPVPAHTPAPTATPVTTPTVPAEVLNRISALETLVATLQGLISTLEGSISTLNSNVSALASRVAALEADAARPTPTPTQTPVVPTPTTVPSETPVPTPVADSCLTSIPSDGATNGRWTSACATDRNLITARAPVGTRYAGYYTFALSQQSEVTITLESSEDTYLFLLEGTGRDGSVIEQNDDIDTDAQNYNSRIVETLAAGEYTILATTYNLTTTGDFTLTVSGIR